MSSYDLPLDDSNAMRFERRNKQILFRYRKEIQENFRLRSSWCSFVQQVNLPFHLLRVALKIISAMAIAVSSIGTSLFCVVVCGVALESDLILIGLCVGAAMTALIVSGSHLRAFLALPRRITVAKSGVSLLRKRKLRLFVASDCRWWYGSTSRDISLMGCEERACIVIECRYDYLSSVHLALALTPEATEAVTCVLANSGIDHHPSPNGALGGWCVVIGLILGMSGFGLACAAWPFASGLQLSQGVVCWEGIAWVGFGTLCIGGVLYGWNGFLFYGRISVAFLIGSIPVFAQGIAAGVIGGYWYVLFNTVIAAIMFWAAVKGAFNSDVEESGRKWK